MTAGQADAVRFAEVADRVYVLRYPVLDVNVTLVVGDDRALLVDTLSSPAQAAELVSAVRRVTPTPLVAVNTHHHFDHCFGNAVLAALGAPIWAQVEAVAALRDSGPRLRRRWYDEWAPIDAVLAESLATTTISVPDHVVTVEATVDVGGRPVLLRHPGRGHTAGDLVVLVPDADVLIAGDLIEEGGDPQFEDAYPVEWPDSLATLLPALTPATRVVPGHGAVVDAAHVVRQHAELTALGWLIRAGHADGATVSDVAAKGPYPVAVSLVAVKRGYAELDGRS